MSTPLACFPRAYRRLGLECPTVHGAQLRGNAHAASVRQVLLLVGFSLVLLFVFAALSTVDHMVQERRKYLPQHVICASKTLS